MKSQADGLPIKFNTFTKHTHIHACTYTYINTYPYTCLHHKNVHFSKCFFSIKLIKRKFILAQSNSYCYLESPNHLYGGLPHRPNKFDRPLYPRLADLYLPPSWMLLHINTSISPTHRLLSVISFFTKDGITHVVILITQNMGQICKRDSD